MITSHLSRLARWHRTLALIVVLPLLAWSLTGLLHPLMTRWQPSAAAMVPPPEIINAPSGTSWQALPAPASVLPKDLVMTELRPLTWQGTAYWMAGGADGTRQYFRAHDGQLSDIEPALMTALARHFTGISSGEAELQLITSFSAEYPFINRYLPVWRVQFSGHDTVTFIEPRGLRLSALSDPWKTWFSATFSRLHSWSFWSHEPSRDIAMAIVLSLGLAVVVTGIFRLFRRKTVVGSKALNSSNPTELSAPHAARRWHRRLGWFVALGAIASMSSGMFHVLAINKSQPSFNAKPERVAFSAGQLRTLPPVLGVMGERSLAVASANGPLWMSYAVDRGHGAKSQHSGHDKEHAEHQHHAATPNLAISLQRAENAQPVAIERYVQQLAAGVLAQHPQTVEIDNNGLDPATGATLLPTGSYSESYQRTSPKIGLIYRLAKDTEAYANVSGSFEPPSFSEALNNQPLKAQRAITAEVGARGHIHLADARLGWDASLYRARIRNELLTLAVGTSSATINADKTLHQGVELGLSARANAWRAQASYLYNDFRFVRDTGAGNNDIAGLPSQVLNAEVAVKLPGNVWFGPTLQSASRAWVDHKNTLNAPGYSVYGVKLNQSMNNGFAWFVEGRNLGDKRYASTTGVIFDAGGADQAQFSPGDGRAVYAGVSQAF